MNFRTFTAAMIVAAAASTASAGGLMDEIVETEVQEPVMLPEPSSSEPTWIVLGLIAVLIAVAAGDSGGGT